MQDNRDDMKDQGTPNWLKALLAVTVVVTGGYYINLHYLSGYSQTAEYRNLSGAKYFVGVDDKVKRTPQAIAAGAELSENCAGCHGEGLSGTDMAPNLMDSAWLHGVKNEADLFRVITKGISGSALKHGDKSNDMPAMGMLESNKDVWKVVYYISSKNSSVKR